MKKGCLEHLCHVIVRPTSQGIQLHQVLKITDLHTQTNKSHNLWDTLLSLLH
jgi:hypothetical protein